MDLCAPCAGPDPDFVARARARQAVLTKPPGSLGHLEEVAIQLAGLQRSNTPTAERVEIVVFAADHGVTAQGVSPYPSAVTGQMLMNFANGGAAISVLAKALGARLQVVDVGVLGADAPPSIFSEKICAGTADFTTGPALSRGQLDAAFAAGRRAVDRAVEWADAAPGRRPDLIIFGDMGIGNTTAATALSAWALGRPPHALAGPGTGLDATGVSRKADVVARALTLHGLHPPTSTGGANGVDVADADATLHAMTCVGGLELAAITAAAIVAAQRGIPVLVDGFIVTTAILCAVRLNPSIRPWLIFGHCSAEPAHRALLDELEARALFDLDLRLGEGSGAALAVPQVRLACALHNQMATFAEAAVSGPTGRDAKGRT